MSFSEKVGKMGMRVDGGGGGHRRTVPNLYPGKTKRRAHLLPFRNRVDIWQGQTVEAEAASL